MRLWIDGQKVGEDQTDDASAPLTRGRQRMTELIADTQTALWREKQGSYQANPENYNVTLVSDLGTMAG